VEAVKYSPLLQGVTQVIEQRGGVREMNVTYPTLRKFVESILYILSFNFIGSGWNQKQTPETSILSNTNITQTKRSMRHKGGNIYRTEHSQSGII
jgi:hypothetical protein